MQAQRSLLSQVHDILSHRTASQCNFLTPPAVLAEGLDEGDDTIRVIYRQYATLNFVVITDQQESELGILDLIQAFVEALNSCFEDVCELDLVFGWEVLETVLDEIIQGGMVLETNVQNIVVAVDKANKAGTSVGGDAYSTASKALSSATSAFRSYISKSDGRKF